MAVQDLNINKITRAELIKSRYTSIILNWANVCLLGQIRNPLSTAVRAANQIKPGTDPNVSAAAVRFMVTYPVADTP